MFSKIRTTPSTSASSGQIDRLRRALRDADAVLVGAGAGLSTAAGFTYSGERFQRYFGDFSAKYGIRDMYSGGFYPFPAPEEFWAYWSRYIFLNRYQDPPKPVYQDLLRLLAGKDHFVLTTNVDHCFQKAGFEKKRLFYTQGDYGLFQCSGPCRQETLGNEAAVRAMVLAQGFTLDAAGTLVPPEKPAMAVPAELLPRCPHCGRPLVPNLRCDEKFAEDEGWHQAAERYESFLRTRSGQQILFLELGVGYNTPSIIKYPFWRMTASNPKATYACVNLGQSGTMRGIEDRSILVDQGIDAVIHKLAGKP